ncbi:MAG TPA: hypothetical protein PK620_10200, partial [Denitromonas sp.]|nr:hypothetical protein [Denitromonas sp.]
PSTGLSRSRIHHDHERLNMPQNPAEFTRVSTPAGHFSVPSALVEAAGSEWKVLKQDAADSNGLPYPPKLREQSAAATPQAEASASADNKE